MNYLCPFEMGSAAWYRWFLSGKAWTGGTMFFLNRLLPNVPLYLTYAVPDVGYPLFALALAGNRRSAAADLHACVAALGRGDRAGAAARLPLRSSSRSSPSPSSPRSPSTTRAIRARRTT